MVTPSLVPSPLRPFGRCPSPPECCPCATVSANGPSQRPVGPLPLAQAHLSLPSFSLRVPDQPHLDGFPSRLPHTAELCCLSFRHTLRTLLRLFERGLPCRSLCTRRTLLSSSIAKSNILSRSVSTSVLDSSTFDTIITCWTTLTLYCATAVLTIVTTSELYPSIVAFALPYAVDPNLHLRTTNNPWTLHLVMRSRVES
jgi:hypothetical protein